MKNINYKKTDEIKQYFKFKINKNLSSDYT